LNTIIAGTRYFKHRVIVDAAIKLSGFHITSVLSGGNGKRNVEGEVLEGVDLLGEAWAEDHNIPVKLFEADWNTYGRAAGPLRNKLMAEHADACIAVWDGESKGTLSMIRQATQKGLKVYVYEIGKYKGLTSTNLGLLHLQNVFGASTELRLYVQDDLECCVSTHTHTPHIKFRTFVVGPYTIYIKPKDYLYVRGIEIHASEDSFVFLNPNLPGLL
jgi:hypothetical protein